VEIRLARTDDEIDACWPVMSQLRPDVPREDFVARVRRQERTGYRLACLVSEGAIRAVAGFRIDEMLRRGRHLYIDDLVTDAAGRSRGHGGALFDWCVALAEREACVSLHLESGVQRFDAHRFYLRKGMRIASHHFELNLRARRR
jgi:GNAT superfamily N-acetyltransferase